MKLLTFAVPCYNSASYMRKCIDSLLIGGNDVEIIIINDGSNKDNTAEIANEYADKYPDIVSVVHKENGGHGSGVNKGVELASGLYFKVVDSDDWVNPDALLALMQRIKEDLKTKTQVDLYITNFVYEHVSDNSSFVRNYAKFFSRSEVVTWNGLSPMKYSSSLLMHSLVYRLAPLRESGVKLPEKTFYVDNIFAYVPLPYMKKIVYLDIDLYRYFIGRDDQSINKANFVARYSQQMLGNIEMFKAYSWDQMKKFPKQLRRYMIHCLKIITGNTICFTTGKDSPERRKDLKEMWKTFKKSDRKLFLKLKYRTWLIIPNSLVWPIKAWIVMSAYNHFAKKLKLG